MLRRGRLWYVRLEARIVPHIGRNCIVGDDVTLGDDTHIGDNVILEGRITIGTSTRIDHGCILRGNVSIGRYNWIYPYCVMGTGPQHKDFADSHPPDSGRIEIGDNNTIREFATVHRPTESHATRVGSHCYIMAYPHIDHDAVIGDHVIMTTRVTLGGHVHIHDYANIGQGTQIHPYCRIGKYAMVGMGSSITKDVPPFALMNRQRFTKVNRIGLERSHVPWEDIAGIDAYYRGSRGGPATWYKGEIESFPKGSVRASYVPDFG